MNERVISLSSTLGLLINGENAYTTWGVRMGEGFLDVIGASASMKDFIENKSRLEHGKRVIINNPKVDEREITLCVSDTLASINKMVNLATISRNLNINHTFIQLIKESFLLCLIIRLRITLDSERKSYFPLIDFRIIN